MASLLSCWENWHSLTSTSRPLITKNVLHPPDTIMTRLVSPFKEVLCKLAAENQMRVTTLWLAHLCRPVSILQTWSKCWTSPCWVSMSDVGTSVLTESPPGSRTAVAMVYPYIIPADETNTEVSVLQIFFLSEVYHLNWIFLKVLSCFFFVFMNTYFVLVT